MKQGGSTSRSSPKGDSVVAVWAWLFDAGDEVAGIVIVVVVEVFLLVGIEERGEQAQVARRWSPEGTGSYGRGTGGGLPRLNGDGARMGRMYGRGMVGNIVASSGTWTRGASGAQDCLTQASRLIVCLVVKGTRAQ